MSLERARVHCFLPPYILREIARRGNREQQAWAWRALEVSEQFRGERRALGAIAAAVATPAGAKRRTVYDAGGGSALPGRLVRAEGDPRSKDPAVNEAYDGAGATWDLFAEAYGRNSIDDRGMRLDSTVHFGQGYDNAFWNGRQMVYGDGDGQVFRRFTRSLDVIGHELSHGVSQFEAGFAYHGESGALSEHFSDVLGILVRQRKRKEKAGDSDWIVGKGLFFPKVKGAGIRSMKAPGTAYDDPVLGKDPQPSHMRDYVETWDDNGGVHLNSGIPNRAFYEASARIGGFAWEPAGRIWYIALRDRLRRDSGFRDAAAATLAVAAELCGPKSAEAAAVREGWAAVGLTPARRAR
jgi:Zn-dependent metalloprotease